MKITRLAPARESERVVRMAAAGAALAAVTALTVAGVAERTALAASFTVLGHLHWIWIPAALLLESASMAAFAIMLRRLLAAGSASVGVRPMLAELEHAIASVRAPVLVLADPKDTVVPFETARRLARALPDARLQLVEGAGHHLPRRAPAIVADAIVAFLAAAEISDVPDRSASRDVNSSQILSVLVGRAGVRRAPVPCGRRKESYRWQIPVMTVRAASQPGRGEVRSPSCAPASGSQPNGPPASTPKHADGS